VGLLAPSCHTEAGHRLYAETDFFRLQQILTLKFLGFSLDEIKHCLQVGPTRLSETLAMQRAMMREKREQLDTIIQAIDETGKLLQANEQDWEAIIHVIQVVQMQQNNDWRKKYFTDEQINQMEEWSKRYYSDEQRQKLAEWGKDFTEEDQLRATAQWDAVLSELKRLVATGTNPASPEAQDWIRRWQDLISQFTHGDEGITQSLKNMYHDIRDMPPGSAPYAFPFSKEEETFVQEALKVYQGP
jgi:MerR family transcriptional regulator, thiopeptide resistance regulator